MLAWVTAAAVTAACGNDDGGPIVDAGPGADSGPVDCAIEANFASIYGDLLSDPDGCAASGCHGAAMAGQLSLGVAADLVYDELLTENVANPAAQQSRRVVENDSAGSFLFVKIADDNAPSGRMPLGSAALPDCQIDAVRDWIDSGASR